VDLIFSWFTSDRLARLAMVAGIMIISIFIVKLIKDTE